MSLQVSSPGSPPAAGTRRVGDYEIGRLIGTGPASRVRMAMSLSTREPVAIKIIERRTGLLDPTRIDDKFKKDVAKVKLLRHKYLNTLREVVHTKRNIYIISDVATGGELFDAVVQARQQKMQQQFGPGGAFERLDPQQQEAFRESNNCFGEDVARRYFQQLVLVVRFCHANGMAHLNLKPSNLLLDRYGNLQVADLVLQSLHVRYGVDPVKAAIAARKKKKEGEELSFAAAAMKAATASAANGERNSVGDGKEGGASAAAAAAGPIAAPSSLILLSVAAVAMKKKDDEDALYGAAVTSVGNAQLAAPEIILHKGYSANVSDVWSLGALLFLMLAGHHAFDLSRSESEEVAAEAAAAAVENEEDDDVAIFSDEDDDIDNLEEEVDPEKQKQQQQQRTRAPRRPRRNTMIDSQNNKNQGGMSSSVDDTNNNNNSMKSQLTRARELVAIFRRIERGTYRMPTRFSEGARDLIRKILVVEPARRCTIADIIAHPWFQQNGAFDASELDLGTVLTPSALEQMTRRDGGAKSFFTSGSSAASLLKTAMIRAASEAKENQEQQQQRRTSGTGALLSAVDDTVLASTKATTNNNDDDDDDSALTEAERCLLRGDDAFVIARKLMLASLVCSPRVEVVAQQAARAAGEESASTTAASFQPTAAVRYVLLRMSRSDTHAALGLALERVVPTFKREAASTNPNLSAAASNSNRNNFSSNAAVAAKNAAARNHFSPHRGFAQAKNGLLTFQVDTALSVVPHICMAEVKKGRGDFFDFMHFVSSLIAALGEKNVASTEMVIKETPHRVKNE